MTAGSSLANCCAPVGFPESPRKRAQYEPAAEVAGGREIQRGQPGFPRRLAETRDAPERLFLRGDLHECEISVAIVGSRKAGEEERELAFSLARDLAEAGALIVSGGAIGVDAAAHRGALAAGGRTAVVCGGGLDQLYPERNLPLFGEIVECGGALLSTFEAGAAPRPSRFARRNRVIAGLADAVLVVQAEAASGSLQTAAAAREYGRLVAAYPGSPGCAALLAQGAALVERAGDLLDALAGSRRTPTSRLPAPGSAEALVLDALEDGLPIDEDTIAERTGLEIWGVTRALTGLELDGLALLLPGRNYVRSALARELMSN